MNSPKKPLPLGMESVTKIEDYADAVELFLESQYYRHRAKERTAERERRRQPAQRWQPTAAQYWLTSAALMALSVAVLWGWG
jgi:hypothetical protein